MNRNRINKFIQQHSSGDKNVGNFEMILKLFVTVNIVYTMTACVQFMYAWQMLLMRVWVRRAYCKKCRVYLVP